MLIYSITCNLNNQIRAESIKHEGTRKRQTPHKGIGTAAKTLANQGDDLNGHFGRISA